MNEISRIDEAYDSETGEFPAVEIRLPAIERAEIDMQIATARAYPRSPKQVASRILNLVTLDEDSAEECTYALPRGGKPIKGPSIRFAEALKQSYGNCRSAARVVDVNKLDKYVEAEGVFFDLETNTATSSRVRRRIVDRSGKLYNDDMILVTGNAACSIAMRNAILGGIPKPLWRAAYDAANRVISGDVTTLAVNREKAFKAFAAFGVKPEQIYAALAINGAEDVTVDHIGVLRGMHSALKNAESTVEEMFSPPTVDKKLDAENNPLVDKPATKPGAKAKQQTAPANSAPPTTETPVTDKPIAAEPVIGTDAEHDPEAMRAGAQAFSDGELRQAPDDLSPADCVAWLHGYDTTKAGRAS